MAMEHQQKIDDDDDDDYDDDDPISMPTKKEILKAKLDPPHSAALAPP